MTDYGKAIELARHNERIKRMGESLDEWVDREAADLRDNMKANIDNILDVSEEDKESLLRYHLMVVRQWATQT